jgi:hypothetical protein
MPAWAGPAIPSAHGRVTPLGARVPHSCRAADLVTARASLRLQKQMQIHTACGTDGRLRLDCIASHRIAPPHPPMTTCLTGSCNDFRLLVGGGKALLPSSLPPPSSLPQRKSASRPRTPLLPSTPAGATKIYRGWLYGRARSFVRLRSCAVSFKSQLGHWLGMQSPDDYEREPRHAVPFSGGCGCGCKAPSRNGPCDPCNPARVTARLRGTEGQDAVLLHCSARRAAVEGLSWC